MKNTIAILVVVLFTTVSNAQNFEGKVIYKNTYKSKLSNVTDEQFTSMMGATQDYFIKGSDYKSVMNGTFVQWQIYISKDNKLYSKNTNSETILWNDCAVNPDEIIKVELNKNAIDILGYKCDELIFTCKSGIQKYYFSSKFSIDSTLFVKHKYGNWADYLSKAKAVPLKSIVDNPQFYMESVATKITEEKLDNTLFELPENAKTEKSPY